ncbi:MAG: hypothetical protein Hyperionvirus7_10 [Hyperionvirus sp.]|uniref:Uncharacterized protein n=1 Tax=Hyperionvirus sp. TaxID=2487770 RepID=A0A3G5ADJ6_9VIRU|nr:MAG: hypothetical protein Hyperionvirus7_10 [Hyperionvirus sp.]
MSYHLNPKIYLVPFYVLIEYLSHRDLIRLSHVDPFFKNEIYHKTKGFSHKVHCLKFSKILTETFKNVRFELDKHDLITQMDPTNISKLWIYPEKEISPRSLLLMKNLTDLTLWHNIPPAIYIKHLPMLKTLSLYAHNLMTDEHLLNLTNLTCLKFMEQSYNLDRQPGITDAGLGKLINLNHLRLDLDNDRITDDSIRKLSNLTYLLIIGNNHISDSSIENLKSLKKITLYLTINITGASLLKLPDLEELNLYQGVNITDDSLIFLTNLKALSLYIGVNISDRSLIYLTNLTHLCICESREITDISLSKLINLETFMLSGYNKCTADSFKCLTGLKSLHLNYTVSTSDNDLRSLTHLTHLDIMGPMNITDALLETFINLKSLKLWLSESTKVTSKCLKNLGRLEDLQIYGNIIYENDIRHLTNLTKLNLMGGKYVRGGGLPGRSNLTSLEISCQMESTFNGPKLFPDIESCNVGSSCCYCNDEENWKCIKFVLFVMIVGLIIIFV